MEDRNALQGVRVTESGYRNSSWGWHVIETGWNPLTDGQEMNIKDIYNARILLILSPPRTTNDAMIVAQK